MPKHNDIKRVLVIGSGPIIIGQAAEFDYAGTQACRALKEEGCEVILINSNPATIMTDPEIADHVYIEPLTVETVMKVIEKEKPDSLLPSLGGQSGLNLAMELAETGFLESHNVKLIGVNADAIRKAEDRLAFKDAMAEIDEPCAASVVVEGVEAAVDFANTIGYPIVVRPAYTMGGTGGGIAADEAALRAIAGNGLRLSRVGQCLIERCIAGWKEIEFEVIRDSVGNCVTVCDMENLDPVGVHTGDSIVVAPSQTLAEREFTMLRAAAFNIICALDIQGGCNVQFALHPTSLEYAVIEVNPRVSRSSALASKATGYPIAKVTTKIALGYTLDEIPNAVTGCTTACNEPCIDYVVVKFPRWPFDKFITADRVLSTQMKATGETMGIAPRFEAALLKAIRSLEQGKDYLDYDIAPEDIGEALKRVDDRRIFVIAAAFRNGYTVKQIADITTIDPWFLDKILNLVEMEKQLQSQPLTADLLTECKRLGFTDAAVSRFTGKSAADIAALRREWGITMAYKTVDTCAGEFNANTPYYYGCYGAINEAVPTTGKKKVLIISSGPIRIGQGIEFDYCCVHAVWALRQRGFEVIMVNCNPETVSTDFDVSDKLYFEPLTAEDVEAIVAQEQPDYAVVQFGGQTAIKLAKTLTSLGVPIMGTDTDAVDAAEDRERFDSILSSCDIPRPPGTTVFTTDEALAAGRKLGYPVLVRPSYVLGGQGMQIAFSDADIVEFMQRIGSLATEHPILVDKYVKGREVEVDAICDGTDILIPGVMEHLERAGVHSGDSISVYPTLHISDEQTQRIHDYTKKLALALRVSGIINVQYIVDGDDIYVIEANPRSSRTVPYISKVTGIAMVALAVRVMNGEKLADIGCGTGIAPKAKFYAVKVPVFSFEKLPQADITLGPEMKSTGEVLGVAEGFEEALRKGFTAAGMRVPRTKKAVLTVNDADKAKLVPIAAGLAELGYTLYATEGTHASLAQRDIKTELISRIDGPHFNIRHVMTQGDGIDLLINTPAPGRRQISDGAVIRRLAVETGALCMTSLDTAGALTINLKQSIDMGIVDITTLNNS